MTAEQTADAPVLQSALHSTCQCVEVVWSSCQTAVHVQVAVGSAAAAMEVQRRGARQRQKAATALNYHSSRSHSIFTVRRLVA